MGVGGRGLFAGRVWGRGLWEGRDGFSDRVGFFVFVFVFVREVEERSGVGWGGDGPNNNDDTVCASEKVLRCGKRHDQGETRRMSEGFDLTDPT